MRRADDETRRVPREHRALRVGQELAVARDRPLDDLASERREHHEGEPDAEQHERGRAAVAVVATTSAEPAPEPRAHQELRHQHDRAHQRRHDRAEQHVAVEHVRELVADHALELDPVQRREQPLRHGDRRVLGVASGRERVRRLLGHDVDARLRRCRPRSRAPRPGCADAARPRRSPPGPVTTPARDDRRRGRS